MKPFDFEIEQGAAVLLSNYKEPCKRYGAMCQTHDIPLNYRIPSAFANQSATECSAKTWARDTATKIVEPVVATEEMFWRDALNDRSYVHGQQMEFANEVLAKLVNVICEDAGRIKGLDDPERLKQVKYEIVNVIINNLAEDRDELYA